MDLGLLRSTTLSFIRRQRWPGGKPGEYRYAAISSHPTLYSSCYAAMTLSLYGELGSLTGDEQCGWVQYLTRHQDDDGLFSDPVIFNQGGYEGDPFWCGRPHLTCHVLTALACLGAVAPKPFRLAAEFGVLGTLEDWLEARDWGQRVAFTGNEIMNLGTVLQYARDYHNDRRAGRAVSFLLDWLDTHHLCPESGTWGTLDLSDPIQRSHAVQAAYHWWPLYFYDHRPVPYPERAIDTVLATQNPRGGFGWGVHNPDSPYDSSACEDIDSIDPLVRLSRQADYRRADIRAALQRALPWVLANQASDGGFVFTLGRPFEYGHPELRSEANQGAMFPTWFRTLSLALLGKGLPDTPIGRYPWNIVDCPGFQFWR